MKESIPRRAFCCYHDKISFKEGSEIYSTLYKEKQGWVRTDYCKKCWDEYKTEFLKKADTFWKQCLPQKEKKRPHLNRNALQLFEELAEKEGEADLKKRFVLALYLERKKQIALRGQDQMGQVLFFEILQTGQIEKVQAMLILPQETEKISAELATVF